MHCQGRSRADLNSDRLFSLALVRLLEIIGEAAKRVPRSEQDKYSFIEWQGMVDMRNRLTHGYDTVDYNVVWGTATNDLPVLIAAVEQVLGTYDADHSSE